MKKNEHLLKIKEIIADVCSNNNTYEDILQNLKKKFTHITDPNSPRKSEFNKRYATLSISESTVEEGATYNIGNDENVVFELFLYKNNPDDIVIATTLAKTLNKEFVPLSIELFIYEK